MPALAVADALRAEGAEVSFVGGERAEAELVPAAGYPLDPIRVEGISRSNPLKALRAAGKAALALRAAGRILRDRRADAVLGGGGYVAGPVGLAAVLRRIPLVLTEADSHLGLSNRLLAPRARRVCLAFPIAGPRRRALRRHRPPGSAARRPSASRRAPRSGIGADERCVLVFGGSLGARSINQAAVAAFADAPYRVLHVAGRRDFARPARARPALRPARLRRRRSARRSPPPTWPSRAPAARSSSSPSTALPAVLVPYPHATADHQTANARWMADGGAAVVVADAELTPERLRAEVDAILLDPARLAAMAAAAARLARPDAARDVAAEVLAAASPSAD